MFQKKKVWIFLLLLGLYSAGTTNVILCLNVWNTLGARCAHLLWGTCQPPHVFSWPFSLWHGAPGNDLPTPCSKTLQSPGKWLPEPFMAESWGTGQLLVLFTSSIPTRCLAQPASKCRSVKPETSTGQPEAVGLRVTTTLGTTFVRKISSKS